MTADVMTFTTDHPAIDPGALDVLRVSGTHRLSGIYEYEIDLEATIDGGLPCEDIEQLLVKPCHLMVGRGETIPQEVHGVLRRVELLPMGEADVVHYRVTLVPQLWRATLAYGSRIFQNTDHLDEGLTWPAIVSLVLAEHGVAHELRLSATYPAREYTVQYDETDFVFVSRLLEHFGIFYFFEQRPEGEVMILADDPSVFKAHPDHEMIPYSLQPGEADLSETGSVSALGRVHEVRPAGVDLRDYDWRRPTALPGGEAPADEASGHGTVYQYGDHIKDAAEGADLAKIRAEQLMATRQVFRGRISIPSILPGHKFSLNGHPSGDLDIEYVVTEIAHAMAREESGAAFDKTFTAIPATVPFRSQREAPIMRVRGTTHAIVDGPTDGTAAPIDELGRYKLVFPFDRDAETGGRASRWVRMAQASTGAHYGIHFPLHIGCEVAIQHLGGDPDRPIIIGALPNADTVSPVTNEDATKSRIRTRSGILVELEDDGP